jgi:hypothetical protein
LVLDTGGGFGEGAVGAFVPEGLVHRKEETVPDDELLDAVVRELRAMAIVGSDVPALLRRVQDLFGQEDCRLLSVKCFSEAFHAGVASVSPIAGWCGFGGELSDNQVNSLVLPVLEDFRTSLDH